MFRHTYHKNREYVVAIVICEKRNKGPLDGADVNLNNVCEICLQGYPLHAT